MGGRRAALLGERGQGGQKSFRGPDLIGHCRNLGFTHETGTFEGFLSRGRLTYVLLFNHKLGLILW